MSAMEKPRVGPEVVVRRAEGSTSQGGAAAPADSREQNVPRAGSATVLPAVVGGLSGALLAVAVVVAMTELRPPLDPRLPALAQQVGGFQQSLYALETAIRATEVDIVRALDADKSLAARLDEQTGGFETAMTDIAEAKEKLLVETGPGSVVFGVSTVQLAHAIAAGRPFESEWVNLYALSAGDETVRDALRRLMPAATDGVPTLAALRAELRATAASAGTPVVDPSNLYLYGLNALQSGLGVPLGTTAERQVVGGLVTEADRQLAAGDLEGALAAMASLTEATSTPFRAWVAQAQRRAAADAVAAELTRLSRETLRARAKAGPG